MIKSDPKKCQCKNCQKVKDNKPGKSCDCGKNGCDK